MTAIHELQKFNISDYAIIAIVAASTLISMIRGFTKELISSATWIFGFWSSVKFYNTIALALKFFINNNTVCQITGFGIMFLFVLLFGNFINNLCSSLITKSGLGGANKLLGIAFGFAKGILLVSIALFLVSLTTFTQIEWYKNSTIIPYFHTLTYWIRLLLIKNQIS